MPESSLAETSKSSMPLCRPHSWSSTSNASSSSSFILLLLVSAISFQPAAWLPKCPEKRFGGGERECTFVVDLALGRESPGPVLLRLRGAPRAGGESELAGRSGEEFWVGGVGMERMLVKDANRGRM